MKKIVLTLLGLISFWAVSAQWNQAADHQVTKENILGFEAKTNSDGITFVAFQCLAPEDPEKQGDRYSEGHDVAYYLQIISPDGINIFPNEGKLISHEPSRSFTMGDDNGVMVDDDGNAILIVKDERNWNNSSYPNQSYFVYKVSPAGEFLWDEALDLNRGYAYYMVANIKVVQLTDGSYIFAHEIRPDENKAYIVIEKVSKNGELIWEQPMLMDNSAISYTYPYLVDAGNGNFIMAYSKSPGTQMYAQKFDFDGEKQWSDEVAIYRGGFPSGAFPHTAFRVIPDRKGGIIAAWHDDRYNSTYEKAYVSHILSNGRQAFITSGDEEGLRLSYNPNIRALRPYMAYDPETDFLYALWEEDDKVQNFRSIVLQKISKEGELFWENTILEEENTNGIVLDNDYLPAAVGYQTIQMASEGKIAVFWQHNYSEATENIATLIDVTGEAPQFVWEEPYYVFSGRETSKAGLVSLPLFNNDHFLTFWHDYRINNAQAIFAHKISLTDPTGVYSPNAGSSEITGCEYYNISGIKLNRKPIEGFYIEKAIKSDGSFEVKKNFIINH
ncbi:MAG: hypothetical protein LBH32_09625 [Dysgonamonadaceae bacterium]|jgi:hypothetical protein|nr:hypothetical protein [Dysgonamonadaceae bacterium]